MASTTVNFNLKTAGFANYANQTLTFRLLTAGADKDNDYVVLSSVVTATSAANGTGSVVLFTNGDSDIDSVFEVIFPNREKGKFKIPTSTSSISLADLLVDHVPSGSAAQQNSVYAEAIKRGNHTGTQLLSTISDATEGVQDLVGGMVTGGTETGIDVTYDDTNGRLNFVVASQTDQNFTTADHSKLDGIETGATADQTASEIRALVESATDSNVFTDADHTKLDSIGTAAAVSNFVPRSITFTNTSAYLSLAHNAALDVGTGDFSLSFWARLDSNGTEPVLTKLSGAGYRLRFVSGKLMLTMSDTGGSADFELATGLNDNKWHVYVVSIDRSGNATTYVDNVAQTPLRDVSGTALSLDNGGEFRIGSDGGTNAGDGIALGNYVALHKGSDGALTAAQASQIFFSADAALTLLNPAVAPSLMVDLRRADKTFTDVSASPLTVTTNGTIIFNEPRITSLDNVIINPTLPALVTGSTITASDAIDSPTITATLGLGYGGSGTGGTFDQSTSSTGTGKAKTVALNKATGQITLDGAALAANTPVTFTLTNNTISANDILVFNHVSGGTIGGYNFNAVAGSGTATVTVRNITSSDLTETPVISFAVIKSVTS